MSKSDPRNTPVDPPVDPPVRRRRGGVIVFAGVVALLGLGAFGVIRVNITVNPPAPAAAAPAPRMTYDQQLQLEKSFRQPAPVRMAQAEPEEPEKTLPELLAAADKEIAARQWDDAASDLDAALNKTTGQSLQVADINLKLAQVHFQGGGENDGKSNFQRALSIYERVYGPYDAHVLPALRGLIAVHDDAGEFDDSARLLDRYTRIAAAVGSEKFAASDTEEAAARSFIAAAEKRVKDAQKEAKDNDQEDTSCLCDEIAQSIKDAKEAHGSRSYVVALLKLKQAELNDQTNSQSQDTEKSDEDMRDVLSAIEHRFGPTDSRLAPVLKRMIASHDDDGKYEEADRMIARLSMLKAAPRANPTPAANQKRN
jgi:hypothetical protein